MSTQSSSIRLIDPEEFRPPLEFTENGITVTSFGGTLCAVGFAAAGGEIVAVVDGKETFRDPLKAGKFEIRRSSFIDEAAWTGSKELQLKLTIVEDGAVTAEANIRFTKNYTLEYDAFRKREYTRQRQRELLNTRKGPMELIGSLTRVSERAAATKSYIGKANAAKSLAELAREFAGLERFGEISDAQVLATFLEDDAVELASTLPNDYWFATCLKAASVMGDSFKKISKAALEAAIREVAAPIKANIATVAGANNDVANALKAIEGVVLIADGKLVDNPVFAD